MEGSIDADAGGMKRQKFLEENQVERNLVFDAHSELGPVRRNVDVLVCDGELILFRLEQEDLFQGSFRIRQGHFLLNVVVEIHCPMVDTGVTHEHK